MKTKKYYIIDFDSTFTSVEALDELARISLQDHPKKEAVFQKIEDYTNMAMEGKLSFSESLEQRVKLLQATDVHLKKLITHLKKKVSASFSRNEAFFKKHADDVLIVSGGFKEFIIPVVKKYHIKKENVYANTFIKKNGKLIGYDKTNPLSEEGGKVKLMKQLNLQGELYGIGDGYSDFQLRESGLIKKFFAFTENISRKSVTEKADHITPSLDEFLFVNKLPGSVSYPKNRIACMAVGNVPEEDTLALQQEGYSFKTTSELTDEDLKTAGMLLLAAGIVISEKQLKKAGKLKTIGLIGRAGGNVPLQLCTEMGIVVFDGINKSGIAKRMIGFINKGNTRGSVNIPNLQLPAIHKSHRLVHIHKNKTGVMAHINTILAAHHINIVAQFLKTNPTVGYTITDIDKDYEKDVLKALKKIPGTVQFRVLY